MKRSRTLTLGIINIAIHPHTPEKYVNLFIDTYENKRMYKVRGSDWALLSPIRPLPRKKFIEGLYGSIYKFINIDPNSPWLDTIKMKPLLDENEKPEWTIPDNLKPNLRTIDYVFFPQGHRLFFITKNISPKSASSFLRQAFAVKSITDKFGEVFVNVETDTKSISNILSIPTLTKLTIGITRPNPDDLTGLEDRVQKRLTDQKIKRIKNEYIGDKSEGIEPDDETQAYMAVAASNGYVDAEGIEGGKKVYKSTKESPRLDNIHHIPHEMSNIDAIATYGHSILQTIISR